MTFMIEQVISVENAAGNAVEFDIVSNDSDADSEYFVVRAASSDDSEI